MYPVSVTNRYCADSDLSCVIAPDGLLYKCWSDIGIEAYSVGNIMKIEEMYSANTSYILDNPFQIEKCRECKELPLCMGGCIHTKKEKGTPLCSVYKGRLKQILINFLINQGDVVNE